MKNVQISFDEKLLRTIDSIATSLHLSRSAVVREALEKWIQERKIRQFEKEWIQKLKEHSEDLEDSEEWLELEQWEMNAHDSQKQTEKIYGHTGF